MRCRFASGSIKGLPLVLALALTAGVTFAQHATAHAVEGPSQLPTTTENTAQHIATGERLRVSYLSAFGPKRTTGVLSAWDRDTLRLRKSNTYSEAVPWADVSLLEYSVSRRRGTKTGAIVGALTGLAGGVAFGIGLSSDELLGSSGGAAGYAVVGGAAGALVGALLGAGIGSLFVSEEWAQVSLEDARSAIP